MTLGKAPVGLREFSVGFLKGLRFMAERIDILLVTALLLFVYFLGVGSASIAARLAGKRLLGTGKRESYWSDVEEAEGPERQF